RSRGTSMIGDIITTFGPEIIGAVCTALLGLIGRALVNHAWLRGMLERLVTEAKAVVLEVEQTYVDSVKGARDDGVLTPAEAATARRLALSALKSNLGMKGLRRLGRILGLDDSELDRLLGTHIEAAVKQVTMVTQPNRGASLSMPPLSSSR